MSNFIRVLRNGTLYDDRATAKTKLEEQLAKLQDGEICLASYGASWEAAKTILGVVRTKGATPSYTIFDNEDIAGIVAKIGELDATVSGESTDKHVKVQIIETDGKLTSVAVTTDDIASAKLLGNLGDGSGVESAFGRIAKEVEDRGTAITNAIAGLHSVVTPTNDHSVLTGLTQENGVLTAKTEVTLANVAISGSAADVANAAITGSESQVAVIGTNVSDQISSIATTLKTVENSIDAVEANALKYRTVKVDVSTLPDNSNIKEAYQVVSYTGEWTEGVTEATKVGEVIKIYKDATIHKIYLGYSDDVLDTSNGSTTTGTADDAHLSLNYVYIDANGAYGMASVPVGDFLRESEFKDGLHVADNGEVSVKVDGTSEGFLTVGKDGVKLSGVQTAINNAIAALDTTVTSTGNDNVTVNLTEENGKVTGVTVTTKGLALDNAVVKNVTVNNVNATVSSNNATVTIDGADIAVADNYTATVYPEQFEKKVGADNHIKASDKIDAALKKTENTISVLATEVISNEKVTTAAITKLAESAGVVGADGVIGYQKKTDANYIGGATSVHDATIKLDAAIKTVEGNANNALTEVQGSNAITVSTKAEKKQTVSLKLDTTKDGNGGGNTPKPAGANALTVTDNGLYLSNVWDCGEY